MNWEAVGALGEIVGALAVVISLAYLAVQIRAQNRESRIASVHEITEAFRDSITAIQHTDRAKVFAAGLNDFDDLTDAQRIQFLAISQSILRVWDEAYYQYQEGRLDERTWTAMLAQWTDFLAVDGVRKVWELRKHTYTDAFRIFVDSLEGGSYSIGGSSSGLPDPE